MTRVACIVEGHGEVAALPLLLRRIAQWRTGDWVNVGTPIRVHRDKFLNRQEEFERHLRLAGAQCGDDGWVLVLLDADDICPATLGPATLRRAELVIPHRRVSVVLANREFEAWYIGAAASLSGHRGLTITPEDLAVDPEAPRDAKGWLGRRMGRTYGETIDQPAFAAVMDLQEPFDRCRSFRKLCADWDRMMMPSDD